MSVARELLVEDLHVFPAHSHEAGQGLFTKQVTASGSPILDS